MKRAAFVLLLTLGCGDTGGGELVLPLMAGGASGERTFEDEGFTVTIDDARIAFGPAYFCATTSADLELCPVALAELRGAVTVDALDATAPVLGEIRAVTGTVRSALWDYGRPFLLSSADPAPIAGTIDGHSARFEATAVRGTEGVHLVAELDLSGAISGIAAVRAVRTNHELVDENDGLIVRFDAPSILRRLDWDALAAEAVAGEVQVREGSLAYDTLVLALTSNELPSLSWVR